MKCETCNILQNETIAQDTYRMVLSTTHSADMHPGQFVNIKVEGYMLRRPISISKIEKDCFTIVYKTVGDGTKQLSNTKEGEKLDVFGPLGHGYPDEIDSDRILIIGGGVGVPPLYELARRCVKQNKDVEVVLGFNTKDAIFYEQEFKDLHIGVTIATMDGSYGIKGTVMDAIDEKQIDMEMVCACGPVPMLKAVEQRYHQGFMSFESRMACGMGACMACVAKDQKEADLYHRICKEGPVFPIGKVVL